MDLILDEKSFDNDKIKIKNGKTGQKILYQIDDVSLIGIPLKITGYTIIQESYKYIMINISNSQQNSLFKKIDAHFSNEYKIPYSHFVNNNILKIKKNNMKDYTNSKEIHVSINNIKMKNSFVMIQLFTI